MAKPVLSGYDNVKIDTTAFTAAALAYEGNFDAYASGEIQRVMDQIAEIVQRAVRKRAKRHYRTGRLEKNVRIKTTGEGWNRKATVHSGGHAAHLVAGGVRAHLMQARDRAMPLYVEGRIIGFSEAVKRPATKGDPYFHVGVQNSRLAINAVLKASAKKLSKHLADLTEAKA